MLYLSISPLCAAKIRDVVYSTLRFIIFVIDLYLFYVICLELTTIGERSSVLLDAFFNA